jgi:Domain of unknown function (DUF4126)
VRPYRPITLQLAVNSGGEVGHFTPTLPSPTRGEGEKGAEKGLEIIVRLLMGVGVSVSSGLNAFLPLLIISALAKAKRITLAPGFEFVGDWAFLLAMAGLVGVVLIIDKIPLLDNILAKVYWVIRPAAGGLAFAAVASTEIVAPVGFVIGAVLAGLMHFANINIQPILGSRSVMMTAFKPALSLGQDFIAAVVTILALFVPYLGGVLALGVLGLGYWWMGRLKKVQTQPDGN